ncbi:hypothetical protein ACFQO7_32095 [Catellatospora aurea]|uniref:Uncharacterized protein n=1 Tax=Catellatospora aurea TaxID=1337874 RepID=A0ABW2H4F3_9ACTN
MNDHDLRRLITEAVPHIAPPADRLSSIGRRMRQQRAQRAAVSGVAGVAMFAMAAGFVGVLGNDSSTPADQAAAAPTIATFPTPSATPKSLSDGTPAEAPEDAKARLKADAEAALRRIVPGLTVTTTAPAQHGSRPQFQDIPRQFAYNVAYVVKADGRAGTVTVTVELPEEGKVQSCATAVAAFRVPDCVESVGPNGERIISLPVTGNGSSKGKSNRATWVKVVRTDGSIVSVLCDNAAKITSTPGTDHGDSFGYNTTAYTGKVPPLSPAQVTALALDPALTLYP